MAEARIIDGRRIAAGLRQHVAEAAALLRDTHRLTPGLATILVGDDPASRSYIRAKGSACLSAGLASFERRLPDDTSETALVAEIHKLNMEDRVDGILVQLPLPPQIDTHCVISAVDPIKDVDGFHPVNVGRLWTGLTGLVPCTPQGILMLLRARRAARPAVSKHGLRRAQPGRAICAPGLSIHSRQRPLPPAAQDQGHGPLPARHPAPGHHAPAGT